MHCKKPERRIDWRVKVNLAKKDMLQSVFFKLGINDATVLNLVNVIRSGLMFRDKMISLCHNV